MTSPTALIVDCDPGIDDSLALALAAKSTDVELLAVTTVAGNAPLEVTTKNARDVLAMLGRNDVLVAPGADRALIRVIEHGQPPPHGKNGIGGVVLPPAPSSVGSKHAVTVMAEILQSRPAHSVTVAALGPLTNLALLLALHPEQARRIGRLVVMGGVVGTGNITPVAEFNIWTDPDAAQRVLVDSGLEICLVGLNVTNRATVDEAMLDQLRVASESSSRLADMIVGYSDTGPTGWAMHDALVLAAILQPALLVTVPVRVEVDTGPGVGRGQTVCTFNRVGSEVEHEVRGTQTATRFAIDIDVTGFRRLVLAVLG